MTSSSSSTKGKNEIQEILTSAGAIKSRKTSIPPKRNIQHHKPIQKIRKITKPKINDSTTLPSSSSTPNYPSSSSSKIRRNMLKKPLTSSSSSSAAASNHITKKIFKSHYKSSTKPTNVIRKFNLHGK
jgi:hypothetical protein